VFALVADHAGRALESAFQFERLALQARTDSLTQLPHHGALREVLAGVASRLRAEMRGEAQVFRYGGEEFMVIVPGADGPALATVAERLRRGVGERPLLVGERTLSITCSVGTASLGARLNSAQSLVEAADGALYRAKAGGKNRVGGAPDRG
jgi:two-component system cell cycle response regulator